MDIKHGVEMLHKQLGELETAARELPNKHLADLIAKARGPLVHVAEHPDLEKVADIMDKQHEPKEGEGFPGAKQD